MSTLSDISVELDFNSFDPGSRMVVGYATLNNLDKGGDIITLDASVKAIANYRGNVRVQHDKSRPVGIVKGYSKERVLDPSTGLFFDAIKIAVYISKTADDILDMCDEGVLNGFSIQGQIISSHKIFDPELNKEVRIIDEYTLNEISLVDNPANPLANINSVFKSSDSAINISDNVMVCSKDGIIVKNDGTINSNCPSCKGKMEKVSAGNEIYEGLLEKLEGGQTHMSKTEEVVVEVEEAPVAEVAEVVEEDVNDKVETPEVVAEVVEEDEAVNTEENSEVAPSDNEENIVNFTGAVNELISRIDAMLAEKAKEVAAKEEVTAKSADTDSDDLTKSFSDLVSKVDNLVSKMDEVSEKLSKIDEIEFTAGAVKKSLDEQVFKIESNQPKTDREIFKGAFGGE